MSTDFKRPHSVLVVIYTPARQVLLLHRRAPFDFWQSVTGSLAPGEPPIDAAVREVREETGLSINAARLTDHRLANRFPIPPAWRHRYAPDVGHNTESVFSLCLPPFAVRPDPREHDAAEWVCADEALARIWSWTNRDALRLCLSESLARPHTG
ncbi:dihydroneopterin triphosphate diphosphatase [Denitromonas iodatirespirans]|uniref:dihydroneopterin triphosphate diphosphatase n=1 Tax=Denitromonas iodatirespirans TaxID=2795389 RepID=UPI001E5E7F96|nr:dihydroneopterin triphosphate diphosphatase [Denitromonas iodatirespirans]